MALEEEIGTPIEITGIYWHRGTAGSSNGEFGNFRISMGYCNGDSLDTVFDENWLPGSRTEVFSRETVLLEVQADDWFGFRLDTPFVYDGSGDLLMEVRWTGGNGSIYTWLNSQENPPLCLEASSSGSSSGYLSATRSQFMLEGTFISPGVTE